MRQCDLCGERGFGLGEVECDAGDAGAGGCEGAEGEGGALGGEARTEEKDWVSAGVIKAEWLLRGSDGLIALASNCTALTAKQIAFNST